MCAIAGIKGENISQKLYKILTALEHRGPDGSGVFVDGKLSCGNLDNIEVPEGNFGLGHNLLSIVGCEGLQPLVQDNFVLICNGEIYNYQELKKDLNAEFKAEFKTDSDCEVIIALVKKFYDGSLSHAVIEALKHLEGDYSFAVYDGKDLAVVRDQVGVKPLYFGESNDKKISAFASERKALWEIGIEWVETLPPGFMLYNWKMVELDNVGLDKNLFKNDEGVNTLKRDTSTGIIKNDKNQLKKDLKENLINSMEKRLRGLSEVGIMFSAGVDSTLLAHLSREMGVETLLYSVGHKESPDAKCARNTAQIMDIPFRIRDIELEDVKTYLPLVLEAIEEFNVMKLGVGMPAYLAAEMAHEDGIRVMLSGQGADELFGGYHRYLELYRRKGEGSQEDLKNDVINLYKVNLQRDDAVTMANSVELRVPYLDLEFINMAMNIPMKYKINNEYDPLRKCILREIALDLGVLREIALRPKKAAQYGSGIHKMLVRKVLKDDDYLKSLESLKYLQD